MYLVAVGLIRRQEQLHRAARLGARGGIDRMRRFRLDPILVDHPGRGGVDACKPREPDRDQQHHQDQHGAEAQPEAGSDCQVPHIHWLSRCCYRLTAGAAAARFHQISTIVRLDLPAVWICRTASRVLFRRHEMTRKRH
jgi:hypothetical protein